MTQMMRMIWRKMMRTKPKIIFTESELLNRGFVREVDGGFPHLIYIKSDLNTDRNFLITNDKSKPEEDEYYVDYGYFSRFAKKQNSLTDLDEGLVDDFIKNLDVMFGIETWFEKLITR